MSQRETSSSEDKSISPSAASPQPTSSRAASVLRSNAIEPQAPSRGRPSTRSASRLPRRPGTLSLSPARTPVNSPASSYRSSRPVFLPIEKWTVASLRKALTNSDIQAPRKFTKAELYDLYKNLKPTNLSPKTTPAPKVIKKSNKLTVTPRRTPPSSSSSKTSSRRAPNSGARLSASQGRAPDYAVERPGEDPAVAQLSAAAPTSTISRPTTQAGVWPPPPPVSAPLPTPRRGLRVLSPSKCLAAMAGLHSPATRLPQLRARRPSMCVATRAATLSPAARSLRLGAHSPSKRLAAVASPLSPTARSFQLRNSSPGKRLVARVSKRSSTSSPLQHSPPSETTILALHRYTNARPFKRHRHGTPASGS